MSFVVSKRGGKKFVDEDNFVYVFSKLTFDSIHSIWVCEKRGECNGRLWTIGDTPHVAKIVSQHSHAAQAGRPVALQLLTKIKSRAENYQENPQQIMATVLENVHSNISSLLPKKDSLRKVIQRKRKHDNIPPVPNNLENLKIPNVSTLN